jgi:hypothetical protein
MRRIDFFFQFFITDSSFGMLYFPPYPPRPFSPPPGRKGEPTTLFGRVWNKGCTRASIFNLNVKISNTRPNETPLFRPAGRERGGGYEWGKNATGGNKGLEGSREQLP